jgi:hypothetical protein
MNMELDEMKQAWSTLNRQLAQQQALTLHIYRNDRAERLRRRVRPLLWGQSMQILLGIAIALWGISFWSTHVHVWQAMACGIAMQVFGTLAVIFPARVLALAYTIDYAAPVLDIQRRVAQLRAWRVKVEAPVFAVLGSLIWIPALLMLIQYGADSAGLELWSNMSGSMSWLWLCGAASLAAVGLVYALMCRFGLRRRLEDSFAGHSVTRAEAMLEEIAQFERE